LYIVATLGELTNMEIARDATVISVILYPEDGYWIAQGIEHDIAAHGETPVQASQQFNKRLRAELIVSTELEDAKLLSGVERAPARFAEMYNRAKFQLVGEDGSWEFDEGTHSRFHPRIKITDERKAA